MRLWLISVFAVACCSVLGLAQTAEELVTKNIQAKGGEEKIRAIKTLHVTGTYQQRGLRAQIGEEAKAPNLLRQTFTLQGMTEIDAYDGATGWKISPFEGRKDPELMGEDDLRDIVEDADFYGPLVDYKDKGNTIEYLGLATVDGDDAYRLKVTLKNGDIIYYYLDPDTFIEIRTEKQQFILGSVRERVTDLGAYKQVAGVYFPFSIESEPKRNPSQRSRVTIDSIEANVPIPDSDFKMPAAPPVPSPQKHPEPAKEKKPARAPVKPPLEK